MAQFAIDILGLTPGTVAASNVYPAVDVNDFTQSAIGTTKKYLLADLYNFIVTGLGFITLPATVAASTGPYNATYNNASSGINATLTDASGTFGPFIIDGIPGVVDSIPYLIKNQTNPAENGIYFLVQNGDGVSLPWILIRVFYFNSSSNIINGAVTMVTSGNTLANTPWQLSFTGSVNVGTTALNWNLFTLGSSLITLPLSPANGGTGVSSPAAHTIPIAEGSLPFHFVGPLTNGQLLIGSTGLDPVASSLTAGAGINITTGAGTITIATTGTGISWNLISSSTQTISPNNGYVTNNGGGITFTLPTVSAFGSEFSIIGLLGNWSIHQNSGQSIQIGTMTTTVGTLGTVSSTSQSDSVTFTCIVANTKWSVKGAPQTLGLTIT